MVPGDMSEPGFFPGAFRSSDTNSANRSDVIASTVLSFSLRIRSNESSEPSDSRIVPGARPSRIRDLYSWRNSLHRFAAVRL